MAIIKNNRKQDLTINIPADPEKKVEAVSLHFPADSEIEVEDKVWASAKATKFGAAVAKGRWLTAVPKKVAGEKEEDPEDPPKV